MASVILTRWKYNAQSARPVSVVPDGCIDLILSAPDGERPRWIVTELDDAPRWVRPRPGEHYFGMRMQPGQAMAHGVLKSFASCVQPDPARFDEAFEWVLETCPVNGALEEALSVLACEGVRVSSAAKTLGVSVRSLERLVISQTNRPPVWWRRLARARRAARAAAAGLSLAETALFLGYSDQAHMTRDVGRIFGLAPGKLARSPIAAALRADGYD